MKYECPKCKSNTLTVIGINGQDHTLVFNNGGIEIKDESCVWLYCSECDIKQLASWFRPLSAGETEMFNKIDIIMYYINKRVNIVHIGARRSQIKCTKSQEDPVSLSISVGKQKDMEELESFFVCGCGKKTSTIIEHVIECEDYKAHLAEFIVKGA